HLGPERPTNIERMWDPVLREARRRLEHERQARSARTAPVEQAAGPQHDEPEILQQEPVSQKPRVRYRPLTPSDKLKTQVKQVLATMPQGGSRRAVLVEFERQGLVPSRGGKDFATRLG